MMESSEVYQFCIAHTQADRWLRTQIAQAFGASNMTMMEWLLLQSVEMSDKIGLSITKAAELLGVSLPQVTALTQGLVKQGLLRQNVDPEDRRSRRLFIEKKGRQVCKDATHSVKKQLHHNVRTNTRILDYAAMLHVLTGGAIFPYNPGRNQ